MFNYLFAHFYEERDFATVTGYALDDLHDLIDTRLIPDSSYLVNCGSRSMTTVSDFCDRSAYRFHLKTQVEWTVALHLLALITEYRARSYFEQRYNLAKDSFLNGKLGGRLASIMPDIPSKFDAVRASATWEHFLKGTYGVCTRDGLSETFFLKQVGVDFIEQLTMSSHIELTNQELPLLREAVDFLDSVLSGFAPQEVY